MTTADVTLPIAVLFPVTIYAGFFLLRQPVLARDMQLAMVMAKKEMTEIKVPSDHKAPLA
jgi:hypothetical protein